MDMNSWFVRVKEERKNLSFFKTFSSSDLSSECMRSFPFNFMKSLPEEDLSNKMVIRAKWGSSWEVDISKNPRFYYMEKSGWNQFVRDNALGKNEFVNFTHKGGIKQEQDASMEGVEKKAVESKTSKKLKKVLVNSVEIGESSRRVKLNVSKTSKMKKVKRDGARVKNDVPEFEITIKKSGLTIVGIPKSCTKHIPKESTKFTIHHSKRSCSWEVMCWARETKPLSCLTAGWIKLAREYPLEIGDKCTFQLFKRNHFLLSLSRRRPESRSLIDDKVCGVN